ncbi:hypothetical protein AK812_SmicGene6976 [Symbiodinium microadriaticum]|uniref:Uncharacterized protein n=1 Tax=Symbiodinium microadriaticum TaxID=2951 RepID=A0A1Q9EPQ3_SYMMI|nr:hypothetical protein AK812_SmicGene6976 [Symbiodinium microadriaticum]
MPATLLHWIAGVGAAISIKISSSIDDVVWLAPFLTNNVSYFSRLKNISIYGIVCWVQTAIAMCIAYSGNKLVEMVTRNSKDAWSSEKILTVLAGSMLALYSIKLLHEWVTEAEEEPQDTKEDAGQENKYAKVSPSDLEGGGELTPGRNESRQLMSARNRPIESANAASEPRQRFVERQDHDRKLLDDKESAQTQTLFVIAFIGSLDDLTLFVPMLVGKGFPFMGSKPLAGMQFYLHALMIQLQLQLQQQLPSIIIIIIIITIIIISSIITIEIIIMMMMMIIIIIILTIAITVKVLHYGMTFLIEGSGKR